MASWRSEMNARFVTRLVSRWPIIGTSVFRSAVGEQFGFKESIVRSLEASRDGPVPHSMNWKGLLGMDGIPVPTQCQSVEEGSRLLFLRCEEVCR